jgi:sulfate transport system ATP-binding protein
MEVASRIVVMNRGRIEQVGTPDELYEHPATEFVMSFVGKVNRVGDAYIRPHDIDILLLPATSGLTLATVERLSVLGFETRVHLVLESGQRLMAQVSKSDLDRLDLQHGQQVSINLRHFRAYARHPGGRDAA